MTENDLYEYMNKTLMDKGYDMEQIAGGAQMMGDYYDNLPFDTLDDAQKIADIIESNIKKFRQSVIVLRMFGASVENIKKTLDHHTPKFWAQDIGSINAQLVEKYIKVIKKLN